MHTGEAVIYLAGSRAVVQNDTYRSYETFIVKDETLAGKAKAKHKAGIVIPLVGDVECNSKRVSPGQATSFPGDVLVSNPYEKELVNYLFIKSIATVQDFDLDANPNLLQPVSENIHIGKFAGRFDSTHRPYAKDVFVFVIEGVFEVQNRLLHARDGLTLSDVTEVEFEALSNDAIILVIDR